MQMKQLWISKLTNGSFVSYEEHHYMYSDIICRIQSPEICGVSAKNKRRHTYKIADAEYNAISFI